MPADKGWAIWIAAGKAHRGVNVWCFSQRPSQDSGVWKAAVPFPRHWEGVGYCQLPVLGCFCLLKQFRGRECSVKSCSSCLTAFHVLLCALVTAEPEFCSAALLLSWGPALQLLVAAAATISPVQPCHAGPAGEGEHIGAQFPLVFSIGNGGSSVFAPGGSCLSPQQ